MTGLLRFARDSWAFVQDRYIKNFAGFILMFFIPTIAHFIAGIIVIFVIIFFDINIIVIRAFLVCLLVSSIPYLVYYNHLKNKGE